MQSSFLAWHPYDPTKLYGIVHVRQCVAQKFADQIHPSLFGRFERYRDLLVERGLATVDQINHDPISACILGAAASDEVVIVVGETYRFAPHAFTAPKPFAPLWESVAFGRLLLCRGAFLFGSPEYENENKTLSVGNQIFDVLPLRTAPAKLDAIGVRIVNEAENRSVILTKVEFRQEVLREAPATSESEIQLLWEKRVPAHWRKAGRRSKQYRPN
jgi:hypothetical protein